MKSQQSVKHLEKFLSYVLSRRPDEFGLVPNPEGWIKIKELLKAVNEEDGWRHIRRAHINEMLLSHTAPEVEIEDNRIRSKSRDQLFAAKPAEQLPKLLYTCVRRRAYPAVQEKGLFVSGEEKIVLTADPELARRIGKRRDPNPVLLTVRVEQTFENSVVYQQVGEQLFLADFIPAGTFSGPALPKEKTETAKKAPVESRPHRPDAGSFILDPSRIDPEDRQEHRERKRKEQDWKKDRRQQRKHKERSRGSF
jgi:putative RNA 2'-phosphotransferase